MMMTTGFRPRRAKAYNNCGPKNYMGTTNLTNISENESAYEIEITTPGWTKDEIKIEAVNGHLNVDAVQDEQKGEKVNYTKKQFSKRNFKRSFILPENVSEDGIEAKFENGILRISLHKTEVNKSRKEISIS